MMIIETGAGVRVTGESLVVFHTSHVTRHTSHFTGIRGFNKLHKSVSTIGLCGLDKLLSFMVTCPPPAHWHVLMSPSCHCLL